MRGYLLALTATLMLVTPCCVALAGNLGLIANGDLEGGYYNTGWWCSASCGFNNSGANFYLPNSFGWNNVTGCGTACSGADGAYYATHQDSSISRSGSSTKFSVCVNPGSGNWKCSQHQVIGVPNGAAFRVKMWSRLDGGNCPPFLGWKPGASSDPNNGATTVRGDDDDAWTGQGRWMAVSMYGTNTDAGNQLTVLSGAMAHPGTACNHVWIDNVEASLIPTSLQNGSFEGSDAHDRAALVGWDVSDCGSKKDFAWCASGTQTNGPSSAQTGTYYAFRSSTVTGIKTCISQVLQVTPGVQCTFSCYAFAPSGGKNALPKVGVKNGTNYFRTTEPTFDASSTVSTRGSWQLRTVTFTPTGGTVTLILFCKQTQNGNWGAAFDNATFSQACAPPAAPTGATATPSTICTGSSSTLSATPGSGGDQVWWYTGSCGGTQVGTGPGNQTVSPTSTTTYYARTKNSSTGYWSTGCTTVTVTVSQPPTTATVGGPQTICALGTTTGLGGNTPAVGTGAWSVVSGGTGTFNPGTSTPNATFTHATGTGPVVLRWTISNAPCTASSADVTITVNQPPTTATVGDPQTICNLGTTGLGGNTPGVGTGAWSVVSGGAGTFSPGTSTPNATFTHTSGAGPVVLRWTISNAPCTASTADVTVTVSQPPTTATVGGPQTICALGTTTGLGGNTPAVGTGAWSVVSGGTGTFNPGASTPNATFTHSTGTGPVVLRWTISNAPCTASTADVTITVNQPPTTATVGGPQTICNLGTTTGLGGNTPGVGTGAWSVVSGGAGTFSPGTSTPNATFTHTSGTGPVVLRWTISNAPCTPSSADVTVTVSQSPETDLGVSPAATAIDSGETVDVTVSSSETGVEYQLYNGAAPSGSPGTGNGGNLVLTSAALTSSCTLTVKATRAPCTQVSLIDDCVVTVNAPPVSNLITNGWHESGYFSTGWWCSSTCGYSNPNSPFYLPNGFTWNNVGGCGTSCGGTGSAYYATHQDSSVAHTGSSTKLTVCHNPGAGSWKASECQLISVPYNAAFRVKLWSKHDGGNCPPFLAWKAGASTDPNSGTVYQVRGDDDDAWTNQGRWMAVSLYGTNTDPGNQVMVFGGAMPHPGTACNHVWIDDVEASLIPSSLQNGSFEGTTVNDRSAFVFWDVSDCGSKVDFPICVSGSQTNGPSSAQSGAYYAFAASTTNDSRKMCLSQVVQVTPGLQYTFSCYVFAPSGGNGDMPIVGVRNGTNYFRTTEPTFDASTTLGTRGAWTQVNVNFTATSSTATLLLFAKHTGTGNWGAAFDNASLVIACTPPAVPTGATATPSTICTGSSSTLSATPGSGGDEVWWYSGSCGGTLVGGPGNQVVSPTATTTYYARTKNSSTGCFSATCATVTVTNSTPLTNLDVTPAFAFVSYGSTVDVTVESSETGVTYQLYDGANPTGNSASGNGSDLVLTSASATADCTLTVKATRAPCAQVSLTNTVDVTVTGAPLFFEDWEAATLGTLPSPWLLNSSNSETWAYVVQGFNGNLTKVLQFHDNNANTQNNHVKRTFTAQTSGAVDFKLDVCFPNNTSGWGMRLTNGGTVTTGANWASCIKFEGSVPYATGAIAGDISYQTTPTVYTRTSPVSTFSANTWYTVKMTADLTTQKYYLYFGPKGGALSEITPAGGVTFIAPQTQLAGLSIWSSARTSPETSGDCYLDDLSASLVDLGPPTTVAGAKTYPLNSSITLTDKIVTLGTDQTKDQTFFYIQEAGVGMRVRSGTVVHQGDKVTVSGYLRRKNDAGTNTTQEGEREIEATTVTVTYGPNTLPAASTITNDEVGGAATANDSDGYPCQNGVWASSTGANCGYDQISETNPNNVGQYVQTTGTVAYVDNVNRFFYINDGSNVVDGAWVTGAPSPLGIRVLAPPGVPLTGLLSKSVTVAGVVGSVAASEAGAPTGGCGAYIRNIRVLRACPEMFLDLNQNGFRDSGEAYIDINGNAGYDGISVTGVSGPSFISRFDRYGTLINNGAAFMPKGLYCYSVDSGMLNIAKNQGFNSVQCFDAMTPADLSTFNSVGVKAFPTMHNVDMRDDWMAVKTNSAIVAWYLNDEPEWHGEDPATNYASYQWIYGQDGTHPVGNSHADINYFDDYAASDDMLWIDRYPVGNTSSLYCVPSIRSFVETARAAHGGSRYYPAWDYVQMFDEGTNFVLPTVAQFRALIYTAMASHVKGYFYFSYENSAGQWQNLWNEAANVNSQMDTLRPFLVLPWVPLDVTSSNSTWVTAGGFRVGNDALLIVVNMDTDASQQSTITLPGVPDNTTLTGMFGGANQALTGRAWTETLDPLEVRILRYGSIPANP